MSPKESSINDFGLLIAYVLPGFAALWGATYLSDSLKTWIGATPASAPTVGGFLYTTVASIAAGLLCHTIRWLIVDTILHYTGIRPPRWDFSILQQNVTAFDRLIDIHYRYFQFYGGSLVALTWTWFARRWSLGFWTVSLGWADLGFLVVGVVLWLAARDTIRKYYARTGALLRKQQEHRKG